MLAFARFLLSLPPFLNLFIPNIFVDSSEFKFPQFTSIPPHTHANANKSAWWVKMNTTSAHKRKHRHVHNIVESCLQQFIYYARAQWLRWCFCLSFSSSLFHIDSYREYFLWFLLFFGKYRPNWLLFYSYGKILKILRLWATHFVWKREIRLLHVILSFLLSSCVHVDIHTLHILLLLYGSFWFNPHCSAAPYYCAYRIL